MTRRAALSAGGVVLLALCSLAPAQEIKVELVASTPALSPDDERKAFRLPPGFEAQLVAADPDIAKPMNIAFDDRGRLWVTDTLEYPFPAAPGKKPRDTVKILEDFGPDGRARKITTFADGLNIPIGLLPLVGGPEAIVYGIPNIWKFTDTDGDGKSDKRVVLYEKYGFRDTHGMTNAFTWGFDDWIYACHGFSNDSTIMAKDGSKITMNSGNVYRFKRDGSRVEQVTWGQVNPFGLCLDPLGNLYSADCHSMPLYQLLRGAYYPSFGKPHDGLGYGPEMMKHHHSSTGLCGVAYYAADHFPKEYHGTMFIGNVVTSRINHDRIDWKGSSPCAFQKADFLTSNDPWFRPVDIKLGPDGALYIADFYNCIIGHYEVDLRHPKRDRSRGRIWRIVYRGEDGKGNAIAPRPDWNKATIKELIEDLGHPNLTVRMFATQQLAARKKDDVAAAIKPLMKPESKPLQRVHGLWVLERLGALDHDMLCTRVKDDAAEVRVHALRVLSERKALSMKQFDLVVERIRKSNPNVKRAAADTLGRHPSEEGVRPLLELLQKLEAQAEDTHLRHVARMALREQLRPGRLWPKVSSPHDSESLADVAVGVLSKEAARFLLRHMREVGDSNNAIRFAEHIARHGDDAMQADLVVQMIKLKFTLRYELAVFQAIDRGVAGRGGKLGNDARTWGVVLVGRLLDSRDHSQIQAGIAIIGSLRLTTHQERLVKLFDQPATEGQQIAALDAIANLDGPANVPLFGKVLGAADRPFKARQQAAVVLGRLNTAKAREILVQQVQSASAAVQTVIAVALAGTPTGAEVLLKTIEAGKASARLLQDRAVAEGVKKSRLTNVEKRIAKLTEGLPSADQRINDLIAKRREGFRQFQARDAMLGLKVFEKNCATCHQIGGKGQRIGPQLDGIGVRGVERLLEDMLDPSRNVDQAFRTTILTNKKGQVLRGLLLREEGGQYVMADDQGKEKRIARDDVEERVISPLSPMPASLDAVIPETELYHLLAYLLTQRPTQK